MLLPANCSDAGYAPIPFNARDTLACCTAYRPYWALGWDDEPPLCRCPGEGVYRFEWRSSFDGDATVRIGRQGEEIELRWQYRWFGPGMRRLSVREWERLTDALEAATLWSLDPNENLARFVLDGAKWVIEGRRGQDFHVVVRRLPEAVGIDDFGRMFFDLAGAPLGEVRLY